MKRCIVGFVMLAAVGGAVVAEDKADADVKKLEGEWNIEAVEIKGKKIDGSKGKLGGIVFAKEMKLVMKSPGQKDQPGTYKVDATKKPRHLDLIEGEKKETMQAIYELDGDNLKLGFPGKGPKGTRPTGFDDKESLIIHLKRQKP